MADDTRRRAWAATYDPVPGHVVPPAPPFEDVKDVVLIRQAEEWAKRGRLPPERTQWNTPNYELWRRVLEAMPGAPTVKRAATTIPVSYSRVRQVANMLHDALRDGGFVMTGPRSDRPPDEWPAELARDLERERWRAETFPGWGVKQRDLVGGSFQAEAHYRPRRMT